MLVPRILVPVDAKAPPRESAVEARPYRRELEATAGPRGWPQGAASLRPTLVSRILVPVEAKAPPLESTVGKPQYHSVLEASAVPRGVQKGGAAPRPMLFAQSMLENSPTKPQGRTKDLAVSLTVHGILLAALFLVPLYFTEAIDSHQFNSTLLVAPPAPPPPPPPASAAVARRPAIWKKVLPITGKLVAPRVIPSQIARSSEEPGGTDLAAAATGVSGAVPGGQLGGIIGGIVTDARDNYIPPPPTDSGPKRPIPVGGEVKPPRLIVRVAPVYPPLLKKARVSGDVVIDAVIDTQGNVVEMHAVSGDRLLIPPAMDALRRWKYEPTVLGGQAFPVELQVTIEFRLT